MRPRTGLNRDAESRFMKVDFNGKSVIVTGGSKGIGLAMADAFAGSGAHVAICARNKKQLADAEVRLGRHGGQVYSRSLDVREPGAVEAFVEAAGNAHDGVDVLINNVTGHGAPDTEEGWHRNFEIDLMALVHASWAAVPLMEQAGSGAIIHMASINGLRTSPRTMPYSAIKAAIIHLTKCQASALAEKTIRVNCIAPGSTYFDGGFWDDARTSNPQLYKSTLKSMPFGRLGKPEEVAQTALFLASDAASWVTGQTIAVDGGQSLT